MRTDCEGSVREPQLVQTAEPTSSSQTVVEPHSLQLTAMQGEENWRRLNKSISANLGTAEIEREYP